jgi:hypothetical protein
VKLAIMQPYFLPYIGYFQLIAAVDRFIVYDNIKYTKKGWINRNRMLRGSEPVVFSLPLRADSDALEVRDRALAPTFDRAALLNRIREAYRRAPCFEGTFEFVRSVVLHEDVNLFGFVHHSIARTCAHLGIGTPIVVSSTLDVDHCLRAQDRVLSLCRHAGATTYVNAIGGTELYHAEDFRAQGIDLRFLRSRPHPYPQAGAAFVPWLSILDVMMFNETAAVREMIAGDFELVEDPGGADETAPASTLAADAG